MADDTGDLLVRAGLVSSGALEEARRQIEAAGGTLGEHLVENDAVTDEALTEFYTRTLQVPRIRASALARIPVGVIDTIPRDMAVGLRVIPIARSRDNRLTVAMSDPSDDLAIAEIASTSKRHVVTTVATQMQIAWCLAYYYDHITPLGRRLAQSSNAPPGRGAGASSVAGAPRTRTASGEIRVRNRASTQRDSAPESATSSASTPRMVVEVQPSATDDDTAKIVARRRKRAALPQPPELADRAGEVDLKSGPELQVTSGPTIVVELGSEGNARDAAHEVSAPMPAHHTQISEYAEEEPTAPMWFERKPSAHRAEPTKPGFIALSPSPSEAPSAPARAHRSTRVGVPRGPSESDGVPSPTASEEPLRTSDDSGPTHPERFYRAPAEPRGERPDPTIPPPLLGENADFEERDSDAIPIPSLDEPPLLLATTSVTERNRPHSRSESEIGRALEDTTQRVLTLIHNLEVAVDRDAVVAAMVSHLSTSHRRAGLFVVRNNELALFSMEPPISAMSVATLRLDRPSTLQEVVESRLPYRGAMHDQDSRAYLQSVLGVCPPEILLVPIAVRDRVVGVLFGEHRLRHTFDDQLALAARAAGLALERILKTRR